MICRLCLKELEALINIFKEMDGKLKTSEVVGKHFSFEPKNDDPISTYICKYCWHKVYDFHEFYKMVEVAQGMLQNNFTMNAENLMSYDCSTNNLKEYYSYKCEKHDGLCEIEEVPFYEPPKEMNEIDAKESKFDCRDVLSDNSLSDGKDQEINSSCKSNKMNSFNEKDILPKSSRYKNNRSRIVKSTIDNSTTATEKEQMASKKRRGRPRKDNNLNKRKNSPGEKEAYKAKIKAYDAEIAKYMSLYCDICNSESENFPALRVHMRNSHNISEGYVTCCEKKFNKRALLLYHIRQHLNPSCYRCEECNYTFSDRQSRHNHFLVKHQKDEDKIFGCSQCSKKFVRKYLLEQHKSFSHRDFIPKCKNCGKRFKTVKELSEHKKEDCYPGTMCDICAKCIRGSAAFRRHQLEHQGVAIPKEQCDLCGLWYKDKRGLKRHKRKHMEAKEPHVCDICQKVSPSRSAMLSHKRYAHGTDRVHECSVCQKTFKKPISLREHMTTHTGEVLYMCPHCPKTFNSNANMHSHRKKIHPKEFEETRKKRKQNTHLNEYQEN